MKLHQDVVDLARRVSILDDETALLDGLELRAGARQADPAPVAGRSIPGAPPWLEPAPQISWLAMRLYEHCYIRPTPQARVAPDDGAVHAFRLALSTANSGRGTWEAGWVVESTGPTWHLVMSPYQVRFSVPHTRVRSARRLEAGAACEVRVPKERRNLYPGYYFIIGDEPWPSADGGHAPPVRVYWNVTSAGAPRLVAGLSTHLNRNGIPFWAKARDTPDGHGRADSAVLYLPIASFEQAGSDLAAVSAELEPELMPAVPMFTMPVAPGVGVAEDPLNGLSFGQHRCELVARALWKGDGEQEAGWRSRYELIAREFRAEGLDVARPHLSAGSEDRYRLPGRGFAITASNRAGATARGQAAGPDPLARPRRQTYLEAAVRLGTSICDQAFWNVPASRCTWVGHRQDPAAESGRRPRPLAASLGPSLYDGQAGIALVLAELFALTGDERFGRTAVGAMNGARQQLIATGAQVRAVGPGFFTGVVGIAYAAWRVASLVGAPDVWSSMLPIVSDRVDVPLEDEDDDIIGGRAGAVVGLLALSETAGWDGALDRAVHLGQQLRRSLDRRMLTGLGHGAAGYGCALLALAARTGNRELLEAGREAIAYEQGYYDEAVGAWTDLRDAPDGSAGSPGARFEVTWCNGAAGIALSRLAAMVHDTDDSETYASQARAALAYITPSLAVPDDEDVCLCHGTGGRIDAVLQGSQVLDDPQLAALANQAAARWLEPQALSEIDLKVATDPTLMLGAAGQALVLLRLFAPDKVRCLPPGPWPPNGGRLGMSPGAKSNTAATRDL